MLRCCRLRFRELILSDGPGFAPIHAKVLICALGLLVFVVDMAVPADLNIAIFYCFVIVLCAWTRSVMFLWTAAGFFTALVFPGLLFARPPVTGPVSWVDWANRVFAIAALLLVAAFIHVRMRSFQLLQETIRTRKKVEKELRDSEARLRLAQLAGRIGSWEWDPTRDEYAWSQECYEILGISSEDKFFATKWMSGISLTDLAALKAAMTRWAEREEFEFDYQSEHPSQGPRWIHTRAKMLTNRLGHQRIFGICHDVNGT